LLADKRERRRFGDQIKFELVMKPATKKEEKGKEMKGQQQPEPEQILKPVFEPGSTMSAEFNRLLLQLHRARRAAKRQEGGNVAGNEKNEIWALAMTHMRAFAIKIKTDGGTLQPGLFTFYKAMEFGPATDTKPRNWMELARFIRFVVTFENKLFNMKAGGEAREEPFRDEAEEGALLRAVDGFVPGERLNRMCLAISAFRSPVSLQLATRRGVLIVRRSSGCIGTDYGVVWSGSFGGDTPCVLKLARADLVERKQVGNERDVLQRSLRCERISSPWWWFSSHRLYGLDDAYALWRRYV
jgi:hypothetical protein